MYHRITDEPVDPWDLAVSPARFEEHLRVLRRTRHPFTLAEFVRNLIVGALPQDAVVLTFDDGYVDNLVAGKPRLAAADVPATVFLTTGYLDSLEPFWWDELAKLILLEDRPQSFELVVRGAPLVFNFGTDSSEHGDNTIKSRQAVLWKIWQTLRHLEDKERRSTMNELRLIFASSDHRTRLGRAMTGDEVRALVADGLVTIGAHTVTHPVLAGLGAEACHREITDSKRACEALIDAPVATFAYPYGDFDAAAREAVMTAGFTLACAMQRGPAIAASDVLALPRIHVPNLDGDEFERALRLASAAG